MRTVINHATILTMDSEKHIYKDGYVVTEGNTILETGEGGAEGCGLCCRWQRWNPDAWYGQCTQPYFHDSVSLHGR